MDFEKVIKHISDTYIKGCIIKREKRICEICNYYYKIFIKYNFTSITKNWDYICKCPICKREMVYWRFSKYYCKYCNKLYIEINGKLLTN